MKLKNLVNELKVSTGGPYDLEKQKNSFNCSIKLKFSDNAEADKNEIAEVLESMVEYYNYNIENKNWRIESYTIGSIEKA